MFKRLLVLTSALVVLPLVAQVVSAPPADRLALANQLAKRGLHAEALKEYEAIRNEKSVPRDEVLFRLGEAYRNVGRKNDALACYATLVTNHPQSRFIDYARLNRALMRDGVERTEELKTLDHVGAPEQIRVTALYWLGETAEAARDVKGAVAWYEKSASVSPSNEVARLSRLRAAALLSASEDASDRRRALAAYLDLAESPDAGMAEESLYFSGMLSYREGRYAEASALFRRLAARFPEAGRTKDAQVYAAWSNYLSGRFTEALALAVPLRDRGNEDAAYIVAASLRYLERRADALEAYAAALKAFPNGRHADSEWFERLAVLAAAGENQAVLDELAKRPDPPEKTAARAWSYGCEAAIAVTNFPRAIEFARLVVVRKDAKLAQNALHRLAWLYERTSDWSHAAQAYRALVTHWPDAPVAAQALFLAGSAEVRMGRPEQACADWTLLLTKYPESPYAAEALYARAMEELQRKEFRAAERSVDELMRRFPKFGRMPEALYWWGVAANGVDDAPEAEKHFRAALAAGPSAEFEREIKLELALILQKRGEAQEASALFVGLIATRAVDRLPPATLQWVAESMAAVTNYAASLTAARVIEGRDLPADWKQTAATLAGQAHEGLGENDAAAAAYARALAADARTSFGAQAALALGRLESGRGLFDEAKAHLADAVERARAPELLALRVQAYAALAANEEERGDAAAALGYHMLVGTLFDDPEVVPHALSRAAAILRRQGRTKEADSLDAERRKRYPKALDD